MNRVIAHAVSAGRELGIRSHQKARQKAIFAVPHSTESAAREVVGVAVA